MIMINDTVAAPAHSAAEAARAVLHNVFAFDDQHPLLFTQFYFWAFFAIVLLEMLDHIVPYMKTVCESYAPADLVRQLPVLLGGMAVYALEVWLAYRKSAERFEKVDL